MADEDLSVAPEPAAPTIQEPQPVDEPQAIPDTVEPDAGTAAEPEDELEEFEWNGKTYSGPKGLKDGILMHKDYTQKRQSDAEKAKALESREAEINQRFTAADEELDLRSTVRTLDAQLAEYAKLTQADWDSHTENNPIETEKHWRRYHMLKEQRAEAARNLEGKQKERTEFAQQDFAKRMQDTLDFASKKIPGWSDDHGEKLIDFATSNGASKEFLRNNMSPALMQMIHWAHVGKQTLSTPAPKPVPTTPAAPLKVVAAKSSPTNRTDLSKMDMDEYIAARKRGVGGKALAG